MNKLKKLVSAIISLSLMITTLPINSFAVSYPVLPQYEFSNFAKITSANFCENSDTTIINIQDLHNNKEVQDNICKLLEKLNSQCKNLDVYIEGASSPIDYNELSSSMTNEEVSVLMNALYANDKLSGAEFFGYKNNKILKPTEQKNIYDENIQNYSFLIKNKQKINEALNNKYAKIRELDTYLEKDQRKTLKFYNAYLNKKISSEQFYGKILQELTKRNISTLRYINTKVYLDILNANKTINQKAAERQLQTVVSNLKNTITYQEYVNLLQDSKNLSDINVIFAYLSANIKDSDKVTKYPDLFKLISLRELSSLINPLELVEEENQMMEDILLSYSKTTGNKDVVFINLFFQIYKKLLLASISSYEYVYYKQNYKNFVRLYSKYIQDDDLFDLYRYLAVAENFNELNIQRNITFVNSLVPENKNDEIKNNYRGKFYNINKILSGLNKIKNIKVIISGGFHTEGINELLKSKKVSYITLTPNVKETDSLYEQNYLDSIVEQAEVDINAISKKPFLEQNKDTIVNDIIRSLNSMMDYFKDGKNLKEVEKIINGAIQTTLKNNSQTDAAEDLKNFISVNFDSNGDITITVDGKEYALTFENGKIETKKDSSIITTLAKSIKLLIKRALGIDTIQSKLSISDQAGDMDGFSQESSIAVANQTAANLLNRENILLPWFANRVIKAIIGLELVRDTSRREYKILEEVLKEQYEDLGEEYPVIDSKNNPIKIGKSSLLVGAQQDGYGNVREYASLFYVVWGTNDKTGANVVKEIYISDILFSHLESFTQEQVREFFETLITHERLEMIAISGKSQRYNSHYKDFPRTSDGFHKYIKKGLDFGEFIREEGLSESNIESQRNLLKTLDAIISDVNEQNSEYSGIISLVSLKGSSYSDEDIKKFLSVRSGESEVISQSLFELADKICEKLKQEYDLLHPDITFAEFVKNNYAFVYKKSNKYMHFNNLPRMIKDLLKNKYIGEWGQDIVGSPNTIDNMFFPIYEIDEENLSLEQGSEVKGKNIIFVEDIISRNSRTYNRIYEKLKELAVSGVQPFVFFDLSKEAQGDNKITEDTYEQIIKDPQLLLNVISNTNGKIKKYVVYWLANLLKNSDGIEVLQQLSEQNNEVIRNLVNELFSILEKGETIINVKNTEIVELILFFGLGEKKDINTLTKQDLDDIIKKYNVKPNSDEAKPLSVKYDEWKDNIPYLIMYSYLCGYRYIDASGINNIYETVEGSKKSNKYLIEKFCEKFNISLIDKKTKLKYFHSFDREIGTVESLIDEEIAERIEKFIDDYKTSKIRSDEEFSDIIDDELQQLVDDFGATKSERIKLKKEADVLKSKYLAKGKLERAKFVFERHTSLLSEKYKRAEISYDDYLEKMGEYENSYRKAVKEAMISAKNIALAELRSEGISMDDSMFAIIIGGSLAKGNIMKDSDIYYDIIVKNGIISKSIEQYFTPVYSSILRDLGLLNYQVSKYSTTSVDKRNINTFVDEQEIVPFLNYELLEDKNSKGVALYREYMRAISQDSLSSSDDFRNVNIISNMYYTISKTGRGWVGKSFHSVYTEQQDKIFTTRWSLMTFESILNKIIFQYLKELSNEEKEIPNLPISVEDQIEFLKQRVFAEDKNIKAKLDAAFKAWKFLSADRYEDNNMWTELSEQKKDAINTINDFSNGFLQKQSRNTFYTKRRIKDDKDFLKTIEEFVYDNSTNLQVFRIGYDKYSHLEEWKKLADVKQNEETFIKAQAIVLLLEMDDIETAKAKLEKLKIKGLNKYLPSLFESLEAIKKIDEEFKDFEGIQGERSLQNYWDLVAKMAGNEETLLALIAHKLTQAKYPNPQIYTTKEEMKAAKDRATLLVHSVYLPLSRRFGNSPMYEYVRNDLFESSNPQEYLNLLNIIETLYGIPYTQFYEINKGIQSDAETFLRDKRGLPKDSFVVKFRPKTLYSMHEKLNSERRKGEIIHTIGKTEKGMVKIMLTSDEPIFKSILDGLLTDDDKMEIASNIEEHYDDLTDKQKEIVNKIVSKTRSTIFENYEFVDHIKEVFSKLPEELMDKSSGLRKKDALRDYLVANNMWVEVYFVDIFGLEIRDLIGLHIVVNNDEYDEYVTEDMEQKFTEFFEERFDTFKKDKNNKQARLKFSAVKTSLPVEICLYKKVDYEEEIYGLYNLETLSAPHYQYKTGRKIEIYPEIEDLIKKLRELEKDKTKRMGNEIKEVRKQIKTLMNLVLFDGTFIHEVALGYLVKREEERKQFVFTPDEYIPGDSLEENRKQVFEDKNLDNKTIFFVEYEGGYYVMDLAKGATVQELMNSKYFADDEIAVYDEDGEPLGMDVKLEDAGVYKVIKTDVEAVSPAISDEELKEKSIRTQIRYFGRTNSAKSKVSTLTENIKNYSDLSEFAAFLIFDEKNIKILDERKYTIEQLAAKLYDENSTNEILSNKQNLVEALKIIFGVINKLELEDLAPSTFIKRSVMIANHYNLLSMFELFEGMDYGVINFRDIINYYKTCIFIKTKSEKISEQDILALFSEKFGEGKIKPVNTRKRPNAKYNLIINDKKFYVDYEGYEFSVIQDLLESKTIHFEYVLDKSSREIGKKENKEKIFITMDFARPKEFLPLMSLGNNVEQLVRYAMVHHSRIVSAILEKTHEIAHESEDTRKTDSLTEEESGLMAQILMGIFSRDSYYDKRYEDAQNLLAQETPYLTQEDIDIIKDIEHLDLSEYADLLKRFGVDEKQIIERFKGLNFKVSRSFDLHVDSMDMYSFATIGIDPVTGNETLFMSEALLREISNAYPADEEDKRNERQNLLRQAVIHELIEMTILELQQKPIEKAILDLQQTDTDEEEYNSVNYKKIHELFEKYEGQRILTDFIKNTALPNTLHLKDALFDEIDYIMEQSDTTETDAKSTIALMFGNLNIDSFINTYRAYRDKKVGRIFISGNTRGSLGILKILRDIDSHPEFKPFLEGIAQGGDTTSVRTVKDLLSLPKEEFDKLTPKDLEALPKRSSKVSYLNEEKTGQISKEEIFNLVSEDGVTEAAIIKWIMLESARQEGLTRKDINNLIRAISLETDAANTLQNIENIFSQQEFLDFISGQDNIDVVIIQNPFSQLRAKATLNKYLHSDRRNAAAQNKTFNIHTMKFDDNSLDYYTTTDKLNKSLGEWTRLIAYTLKGDIYPIIGQQEGLNAIPSEVFKSLFPLLTILNSKEKQELKNVFNFLIDANTKEIKDMFLNVIKDDKEKEELKKELEKISNDRELNDEEKINKKKTLVLKALLRNYSVENKLDQNKYSFIEQFIEAVNSNDIEQRAKEKWPNIEAAQEVPQVDLQQDLSLENRMETMQSILSAA